MKFFRSEMTPPLFEAFSGNSWPKLPFLKQNKLQWNFLDRKWPSPPFGNFPEIHRFSYAQASLRMMMVMAVIMRSLANSDTVQQNIQFSIDFFTFVYSWFYTIVVLHKLLLVINITWHWILPIGIFHRNWSILEYHEISRIIINVSVSPFSQGSFRKAKIVNY